MVNLDLATMSLDDMAAAINTAASGAGSSVTATVVAEDAGRRDPVATIWTSAGPQPSPTPTGSWKPSGFWRPDVQTWPRSSPPGSAFTDGDASTVATGATLLQNLWVDGAGAGVQVGDTLTFDGTRGDGTTFSKTYTVAAGDTLQDVVDALNSATDGYQFGDRTATASIGADGRLIVTDDQAGGSWLALDIVAHNEGGGTLDFGTSYTTQTGRAREIAAGQDALLEVDGTFMTRSSNVVTDAIPGVNLRLLTASDTIATIDVTQNSQVTAEKVQAFVTAFNELSQWVSDQFSGAGGEEGVRSLPSPGTASSGRCGTR